MKVCIRCKLEKEYSCFGKRSASKDGYYPQCKECKSNYQRERFKRPDVKAAEKEYRKNNLDKKREQSRKYRKNNPDKVIERRREYYKNYPDKVKESVKKYRKNNPDKDRLFRVTRRTRKKNAEGFFTGQDILNLWEKQKGKCLNCRKKLGKTFKEAKYHIDHIIPLVKGGTNWPDNIQMLCQPCNQRKSALLPEEFARRMGRLFL